MRNKTHEAEIFCRKTLLRNPRALEQADIFYAGRADFGDDWPSWCGLPMAATYAILTGGADIPVAQRILADMGIVELSNLTAALLWPKSKIVYRFDETLAHELEKQPLDGDIPIEALFRLPYECVFIERRFQLGPESTIGFFAWMEWDIDNKMPELRLLYLLRSGYAVAMPVLLPGGTIDDSYAALIKSGLNRSAALPLVAGEDDSDYTPTKEQVAAAINMVLYLCADEADIPDDTELRKRRSRDERGNPKRTAVWDVGIRIGAAIRKARAEEARKESEKRERAPSSGRAKVRPHIRRAHWHHFWTGPKSGKRKLVVRWLPPIPVNIEGADGDMPTVIYPVK